MVFAKANGSELFAAHELDAEEIERTARLSSLCALAAASATQVLSYQVIADSIAIDLEDVEFWVIDAVSSGVLAASIDQLNSVVTVTRCTYTTFGAHQWRQVQEKLVAWRSSVDSILEVVQKHAAN